MHNMLDALSICRAPNSIKYFTLNYNILTEEKLMRILESRRITEETDKKKILSYWQNRTYQLNNSLDMDSYINVIGCVSKYMEMVNAMIGLTLYLEETKLNEVKKLFNKIKDYYYKVTSCTENIDEKDLEKIKNIFKNDIVLLLREELLNAESDFN